MRGTELSGGSTPADAQASNATSKARIPGFATSGLRGSWQMPLSETGIASLVRPAGNEIDPHVLRLRQISALRVDMR